MTDRRRPVVTCPPEEGRTQQQFKAETDVNNIWKKWVRTGVPPSNYQRVQGFYADVSNIESFQKTINDYHEAQDSFMGLPSEVRSRFNNNPADLVEFLMDANNEAEAVELGLMAPAETPPPAGTPDTPPETDTPGDEN